MQRFFFHLRSPQKNLIDCEGMMLRDPEAARVEASKAVGDFLLPATGRVPAEWEEWRIEVSDQRGRCVFVMAIADAAAPMNEPIGALLQQAAPVVVYLDIARVNREFSSLEKEMRSLVRRTSELVGSTRPQARMLNDLARQTQELHQASRELRQASQELLDRSREQSSLCFISLPHDPRAGERRDLHS